MPKVVIECGQKNVREIEVADGTTLQEVMEQQNPEKKNWPAPTVCMFKGQPLARKFWAVTHLVGDTVASFMELPMSGGGGGGGSDTGRMIMQLAIIVVAAAATWYVGGTGAIAGVSALGYGSIAGAVAGAVVFTGGMLLMGQIFPTSLPSLPSGQISAYHSESASPTYNVNGSTNTARLYQPVPEGFGRMKITPDKISNEWAEYIKNEYYLYQVFGRGRGTYAVEQMAFGGVIFWRNGHFVDSAYTPIQSDSEKKVPVNMVLPYGGNGAAGDWSAAVAVVPADTVAGMLHVNMLFPDGIGSTEVIPEREVWHDRGNGDWDHEFIPESYVPHPQTVKYRVEYQEIDASGNPVGDWKLVAEGEKTGASTAAQSASLEIVLPKFMRLRIRGRNLSAKALSQRMMISDAVIFMASVEVQLFEAGEKVTLFPDNVEPVTGVASQELLAPNASGDWIGPFPLNPPGTKVTRGQLDLTMPRGCGRYDSNGNLATIGVSVEYQYREINDNGDGVSPWAVCLSHTFSAAQLTAIRDTFELTFAGGRYEIRGRRTSNSSASDGRTMDVVQWESAKAFLPGSLSYKQAGVAVKIKATNKLSQNAANNFTVVQTRKLPVYDRITKTWTEPQPTRSYAAAASAIIKAKHGGNRKDKQIDLDTLWGVIQPELGQRGWNCDCWVDGPYDVWQLLVELSQAYLVMPRLHGSVVSFAFDRPGRPVRHEFTPYNIVRGTFQPKWATYSDQSPDDVQVSYLDEEAGFASRDVRARLPESEGRKPAQKNYLGIVNRNHAHKIGVAVAARNRYRRLGWEFETEGMGRILNIGDVVSLNHPRLKNTVYGQVRGWSAESLTILTTGKIKGQHTGDLFVSLTRRDGSPWGPVKVASYTDGSITFDAADYTLLLTQGHGSPFVWLTGGEDRQATVWTLQTSREYKRRVIITNISQSGLYRYKITCINDHDAVDDLLNSPTPAWEQRTTLPESQLVAPQSLRGHMGGTATAPVLIASWLPVPGAGSYRVDLSVDGQNWEPKGSVTVNAYEAPVAVGAVWVRVCAVRQDEESAWAVWHGNTTVVPPSAPAPVMVGVYAGAELAIAWPRVGGDPSYVVKVYPDGATTPVRTAPIAQTSYTYSHVLGVDDGGPWRNLRLDVIAVNEAGESPVGSVAASDPVPTVTGALSATVGASSVVLSGLGVSGEYTGFVLVRGASAGFVASGIVESRVINSLPYTWQGLTPGTEYYFRAAAKDAFFDVAGDFAALNYSDVVTIKTAGA